MGGPKGYAAIPQQMADSSLAEVGDFPIKEHGEGTLTQVSTDIEHLRASSRDSQRGAGDRVELTEEDNKLIRKKTDKVILVILVWVTFFRFSTNPS